MPTVKVALTGVAKDLPDSLLHVYINEYVERACDKLQRVCDFSNLKQGLAKALNLPMTKQELENLRAAFQTVFMRVSESLQDNINLCENLATKNHFQTNATSLREINNLTSELGNHPLLTSLKKLEDFVNDCINDLISNPTNHWPSLSSSSTSRKTQNKPAASQLQKNMEHDLEQRMAKLYSDLSLYIEVFQRASETVEILMLQQAQIIFCTLISSGRSWLYKFVNKVNVLIIDEAGQAVEPEALIPLKFRPDKCLHVGDTQQLPATVLSKAAQHYQFDRSMMLRLTRNNANLSQMLDIQYRMHPAICKWPSNQYYNGRLQPDQSLLQRISPLMQADIDHRLQAPCVFFDVDSEEDKQNVVKYGIKNIKEADSLLEALAYFLKFLKPQQIGVISFYAAQIMYLKDKLNKLPDLRARDVMVSTVDGFQGEEKDVIMISAVRTTESVGFLRDDRRVNVAVTRACHHLYIFGNKRALGNSNSGFNSLLSHYANNNDECHVVSYSEVAPQFNKLAVSKRK